MVKASRPTTTVCSWQGRLFAAGGFFFVALFTLFIAAMILADAMYVDAAAVRTVLSSSYVLDALWLSVWTSLASAALGVLFAVPVGYSLSRFHFPGRAVVDSVIDLPIVFPPLVVGLTLLVFFSQTGLGRWIQDDLGIEFIFQRKGIILCQFLVSASLAIRSARTAFDDVDRRLENVALTLGCGRMGAFWHVSLPLARNGIAAGAILAWARSFGLFGPLLILVGSFRGRTEVLATTVFLEQAVGHIEVALALGLLMILVALVALTVIRLLGGLRL